MGYLRGFIHGSVTGAVIGLCVAPQSGRRTREQLSGVAAAAREGFELARRTARRVAPYAANAASAARGRVDRSHRQENGQGSVQIHGGLAREPGQG